MKLPRPLWLATLAFAACGPSDKSQHSQQQPPVPVEVGTVEQRTMPLEVKAIGTVQPIANVQLKSKVAGEILQVHFADGAQVKAGDVLFSIDPRSYDAALKRAEANLSMAKSTSTNAAEQAQRYTTLTDRGVASKEQFSQYQSTAETQKSQTDARQADVDEAKLSLDWTQVRAPISGRAGVALLKPGNIALANSEILAVINQMQPIYVAFSLPEDSLSDVRARMSAGHLTVTAYQPGSGNQLDTGELTFVDNAVDTASGMVSFRATFPNEHEALWPGQFVDVTVKLTEEPNALVIPTTAIMEGQEGSQVFVVENGVARIQKVEVERAAGDFTILKGGLKPGDQVITTGQLRVANGAKVAIVQPKTTEKPAPAQASTAQ
jgi:multidrug efflux system membrane fusion protein